MITRQANQHSNAPPFCDFLERYQAAKKTGWKHSQLITQRVGLRRFDEWLKASGSNLPDLNWQNLLQFHRFLTQQGISANAGKRSLQVAKNVIRWGIEHKELPQKIEDIYTLHYRNNHWTTPLPEIAEKFLNEVEVTYPTAARCHRHVLRIFHTFLKERNLTYRRLRREHLTALLRYTKDKGFAQRTRATICFKTRAYLRWLYDKRRISRRPEELIPAYSIPKPPKTLPRPLDPLLDQKMQELLLSTDDIYYKSILLLRRTGIRIAELRKLEFECLEFDQKGRAKLKVPPVKFGLERRVPLDKELIDLIRNIQQMSRTHFRKKRTPSVLVIGHTGRPPRYEAFSAAMTEICARLNTNKWINLHSLRHSYATSLLNAGLSIVSLKEILGHKTIHMTLGYAKVAQEQIQSEYQTALSKMNQLRIPELLVQKNINTDDIFKDLGRIITHKIDQADAELQKKKLKALLNRIAKLKLELGKFS